MRILLRLCKIGHYQYLFSVIMAASLNSSKFPYDTELKYNIGIDFGKTSVDFEFSFPALLSCPCERTHASLCLIFIYVSYAPVIWNSWSPLKNHGLGLPDQRTSRAVTLWSAVFIFMLHRIFAYNDRSTIAKWIAKWGRSQKKRNNALQSVFPFFQFQFESKAPWAAHGWIAQSQVYFCLCGKTSLCANYWYENICHLYGHSHENQVIFMWNVLHKHSFCKWQLRRWKSSLHNVPSSPSGQHSFQFL